MQQSQLRVSLHSDHISKKTTIFVVKHMI